jgi:4,5-dihydroxyphthalate decarboxylase
LAKPRLVLAIGHYDRLVPLLDRTVSAEGIDLTVLAVGQSVAARDGSRRHERMLQGEFDAAEIGIAPYAMIKTRGAPFTAIPIFPRRLFSQSLVYCNQTSGVQTPADLIGRKVAVRSYQNSLGILFKGDLEHVYGVPWKGVHWVTSGPEPIAFDLPPDVKVERAPEGRSIADCLQSGEVDALAIPHPPAAVVKGEPKVVRLFRDPIAEETRYFKSFGYPIMHLIAFKDDVLERDPFAARSLFDAFERSFAAARDYYGDPNWSMLPWGPQAQEMQDSLLGSDPWPNGVAKNLANMERFMAFALEQGLISRTLSMDEMFHSSTLDT